MYSYNDGALYAKNRILNDLGVLYRVFENNPDMKHERIIKLLSVQIEKIQNSINRREVISKDDSNGFLIPITYSK